MHDVLTILEFPKALRDIRAFTCLYFSFLDEQILYNHPEFMGRWIRESF